MGFSYQKIVHSQESRVHPWDGDVGEFGFCIMPGGVCTLFLPLIKKFLGLLGIDVPDLNIASPAMDSTGSKHAPPNISTGTDCFLIT